MYEDKVGESVATRVASGVCLNEVSKQFSIIAGGADLTGNTGTALDSSEHLSATNPDGQQLFYGVREHAMGAIMNGIALHGCIPPVGGTFFSFQRLHATCYTACSLIQSKVIYFTHDSVGVGEDSPTHQPMEHIMSLRTLQDYSD